MRPVTPPPKPSLYSRRAFLRQLLGAGAITGAGLDTVLAQNASTPLSGAGAFRFAFLTDFHLMKNGDLRSAEGITACLAVVEKLDPRPEFILVGGDLVHLARDLTVAEASRRLDLFLKIWHDHTALPAHWTFGNHDLVGTSNPSVSPKEKNYGKELFKERFQLPHLFYSFDWKGWHFVILDDIDPLPDRSYVGKFFEDELRYLRADLDLHKTTPTIICTHIPTISALPFSIYLAKQAGLRFNAPKNLVCTNANELFDQIPGHPIRAVLSGHLHHYETFDLNGVRFVNSGAICGSYWKGPMLDCPEGFGVVDVDSNGSVAFDYRTYGWKA
jgi:3',5'-cyclic-AMP phosphodiesterase